MNRSVLCTISLVALVGAAGAASGAISYSTGFEDFMLAPIGPPGGPSQGGWSGGAQVDFTNNDAGDEQVVNTMVHSGAQSWHYARGYNSPGQGTPYTPNVDNAVINTGDTMTASLWFKAHTGADNSLLAIETGNIAGTDRAEIIAYIDNVPGGLTVRSFTGSGFTNVPIVTGLDASAWHQLSFDVTRTPTGQTVSVSVDMGAPVVFSGSLADWRVANMFAYSESSRLKFRTRHLDGDLSFNGFFIDDISYSVTPVPAPAAGALVAMGGLLAARRRR